ncbi:Ig lambda-3 chain C region [Takifugu flavidus]|uniref:Ig lambda-3 chain C region n=1 Tax=Takifugu flavidus TaxID=433684 RepID=A0A5C6MKZ5_9TELE|nr:Ig lambda-3 chain C region [Takifugu flavidus]
MVSKPSRLSGLSSSGCGASHPDRPPPLPRGAAAGQCHTGVSGQRGLPLTVEAELEGGGRQQHHIGPHSLEVLGSDGRFSWSSTLNLPADQWKKVDSVTCEASLGGQSSVTQSLDPHSCSV